MKFEVVRMRVAHLVLWGIRECGTLTKMKHKDRDFWTSRKSARKALNSGNLENADPPHILQS